MEATASAGRLGVYPTGGLPRGDAIAGGTCNEEVRSLWTDPEAQGRPQSRSRNLRGVLAM